mgnify:CR=1 FL=1
MKAYSWIIGRGILTKSKQENIDREVSLKFTSL